MLFIHSFYFKQFLLLFLDSSIKSPGFFISEAETLRQSFWIVHFKLYTFTYENKKVSFFEYPVLVSALEVCLSSDKLRLEFSVVYFEKQRSAVHSVSWEKYVFFTVSPLFCKFLQNFVSF